MSTRPRHRRRSARSLDRREESGEKVLVRYLDAELVLDEWEQFDEPHRVDASALEQIDGWSEAESPEVMLK
jgi:hypothetical protein